MYKRILRGATPPIQRSLFREHLKEDVIRSDNEADIESVQIVQSAFEEDLLGIRGGAITSRFTISSTGLRVAAGAYTQDDGCGALTG